MFLRAPSFKNWSPPVPAFPLELHRGVRIVQSSCVMWSPKVCCSKNVICFYEKNLRRDEVSARMKPVAPSAPSGCQHPQLPPVLLSPVCPGLQDLPGGDTPSSFCRKSWWDAALGGGMAMAGAPTAWEGRRASCPSTWCSANSGDRGTSRESEEK